MMCKVCHTVTLLNCSYLLAELCKFGVGQVDISVLVLITISTWAHAVICIVDVLRRCSLSFSNERKAETAYIKDKVGESLLFAYKSRSQNLVLFLFAN